jgi:hypothetical protein
MGGVILEHISLEKGNFNFRPNKSTTKCETTCKDGVVAPTVKEII